MKKIAVFGGSTSKTSINKKLATFAGNLLQDTAFIVLDLNNYEVPVFSVDLEEEEEYPIGAKKFNEQLDIYDGFIVSLAEHNGTYTAAFKNLFDWASRKNKKVFRDKPVLLMATSPGAKGGASVLNFAKLSFPILGAKIESTFSLPSFNENFKKEVITDKDFLNQLKEAVKQFEKSL
ncbi:NAD(P)H-dependent FMN reductase [Tenacibaculum adriaticum]|uniref:NAD(P)H-dependent FMN reductase n=1 Tax=Tenacibaculum adriaticum TaxID=413713 RepID=A0A5S5DQ99_9FLAO|nr:NAD(P)H-dependent oxidoreductase [Tenacibaculum adriaticum]TYP98130.1 NAD(P)H-dependent FMN reductase [Tenacibaculum adriaticum]